MSILIGFLLKVLGLLALAIFLPLTVGGLVNLLLLFPQAVVLLHVVELVGLYAQMLFSISKGLLQVDLGLLILFNSLGLIVAVFLKLLSRIVKFDLLIICLFLIFLSLDDLCVQLFKLSQLGLNCLFRGILLLSEFGLVVHVACELFILLLFALHKVFPLFILLPQLSLFG